MAYERGRAADESILVTVAGVLGSPGRGRAAAAARPAAARGKSGSGRPDRPRHVRSLSDKAVPGRARLAKVGAEQKAAAAAGRAPRAAAATPDAALVGRDVGVVKKPTPIPAAAQTGPTPPPESARACVPEPADRRDQPERARLERTLFENAPTDRTARSWVVGWTHRIAPTGPGGNAQAAAGLGAGAQGAVPGALVGAVLGGDFGAGPSADSAPLVRRLVEAVVDVLLERRPAEQVRRCVSREVFSLLSTAAPRRAARFAARAVVRSIRLHAPADDAVESTVLVQDGPRVRAIALRFERSDADAPTRRATGYRGVPERLEWRCTALQFG